MGRVINFVIYCKNGKSRYRAYFEEQLPGKWYGVRSERMPDMSFSERRALRKGHQRQSNDWLAQKIAQFNNSSTSNSYKGEFNVGNLKCPTCGNSNFVKCGVCGELTCWSGTSPNFVCAVCGNSGQVQGVISDLSADANEKSKYNSTNSKKW